MIGVNDYMGSYLDRRMKYMIEEWNLATNRDFGDFEVRIKTIEDAVKDLDKFEMEADAKMTDLENRLEKIKGVRK
ncbi:MAG TPA: hypothetical protein VMW63_07035 [Methanoregulaceae archaeon]|nr:hypothetical protein [Methanoregulaceae archaeon]